MTGGQSVRSRPGGVLVVAAIVVAVLVPLLASDAGAADDPVHWRPSPIPSWRIDGTGNATLVVGNTVYVGGEFSTVRSPDGATVVARRNLAAFDLASGALKPAFQADTNGVVRALASSGGQLFVGGSYTSIRGQNRGRLAAVDLTTGALSASLVADTNSNVYTLALGPGRLYVGGSFSTIRGVARTRLAALDLGNFAVTSYAPVLNGTVLSVAASPSGSHVYAGGTFGTVGGVTNPWLVKTDASGTRIPTTWELLQGPPLDLEVSSDGSRLAAAQAGDGNQGSWYDAASGRRLWRQRCDGDAQAVHIVAGTMLTGFHEACDGDGSQRLTANATANGARDQGFRPRFDRYWGVSSIDGDAAHVVIAGDFTSISGVPVGGFAIFPRLGAVQATTTSTTTAPAPTTTAPRATTTTALPTTTTAPPPGASLYADGFPGANGAAWSGWTTSTGSGSATVQSGAGQLAVTDVANAYVRAQLTGFAARADSRVRFSYRWSGTGPIAYLNVYSRGSGGWINVYRPRNGYGLELVSSSSTVAVRRVSGGTVSTLRLVGGAQAVTTQKQWLALRVVGGTIQFKTWIDGAPEPASFTSTDVDASVTAAGQLFVSLVRGGANSGAKSVAIDDLTITAG